MVGLPLLGIVKVAGFSAAKGAPFCVSVIALALSVGELVNSITPVSPLPAVRFIVPSPTSKLPSSVRLPAALTTRFCPAHRTLGWGKRGLISAPVIVVALSVAKFSCPVGSSVKLRCVVVPPLVDCDLTTPPSVRLVGVRLTFWVKVISSTAESVKLPPLMVGVPMVSLLAVRVVVPLKVIEV